MQTKKYLLLLTLMLCLQSCQVGRFIIYNYAGIDDYEKFPKRTIQKGQKTFHFPKAKNPSSPKTIEIDSTGKEMAFDDYLKKDKTVAFLIVHNDSIQYENYFHGYDKTSIVASFSMAKSVLSMLVGIAIDDGYIRSVNDSIGSYIPGLKNAQLQQTTILQLLQMTSGLEFNENYFNPFGHVAAFYYGKNLRKKSKRLKLKDNPDYKFDYKSGNAQLLGLVLDNALPDGKTISGYLQEKIWQPLGMQFGASWSLDDKRDDNIEKTFCCLNARALDFAKLGRLYLNNGRFHGKQIVPEKWVKQSTKVDTTGGSAWYYQYQWWLPTKNGDFLADGFLGQYIYVNPEKNIIIVRLGKDEDRDWKSILPFIASHY